MNTIAEAVDVLDSNLEDAEEEVIKALLHYIIKILNFVAQNMGTDKQDSNAKRLCLELKDRLTESLEVNREIVQKVFETADSIEKTLLGENKKADLHKG